MTKRLGSLLFILFLVVQLHAQPKFRYGFSVIAGTHVNRLGAFVEAAYNIDPFLFYNRSALYLSFQNLGPRIIGPEFHNQTGFNAGWGNEQKQFDSRLVTSLKKNSIGYSYNIYLDNRKTSQVTGTVSMHFNKVLIAIENDIFAHGYYDRYRTGAMRIGYADSNAFAGAQIILWTGAHNGKRIIDPNYPARNGYMDLLNGRFSNYSYGVASAFVQYRAGTSTAVAAAGIDAEQIRNLFQNKLLHDMPFLPSRWIKNRNAHIPMIADDGTPYLYKFGQRIRPIKPYLQLSLNDTGIY